MMEAFDCVAPAADEYDKIMAESGRIEFALNAMPKDEQIHMLQFMEENFPGNERIKCAATLLAGLYEAFGCAHGTYIRDMLAWRRPINSESLCC